MAPVPFRGKTNEPKYVGLVCGKLAELYSVSDEEMQNIIENNTLEVFKRIPR
jgi:TatD DNase family protein